MGKKNKSLMIVESPAKVRTIERFVAKGFKIKATMGHIRDLPVWKLAVDIEHSFKPEYEVSDKQLARIIFAFRICLPDISLVLSTRENEKLRDGLAGIGISRMSVASKTTVGGYAETKDANTGQFDISDDRDVKSFCAMLRTYATKF